MRKTLIILGAVLIPPTMLAAVGMAVAIFFFVGYSNQNEKFEEFFAAVESNNPRKVTKLCSSDAKDKIDEPVLGAFMRSFNERFGKFESTDVFNFETSTEYRDGTWFKTVRAVANFTKGSADCKLVYRGNKLIEFSVNPEDESFNWLKDGLTDTVQYEKESKQLIGHLLDGDVDKFRATLPERFRETEFYKTQIDVFYQHNKNILNEISDAKLVQNKFHSDTKKLQLDYLISNEKSENDVKATLVFEHKDMKMLLVGFHVERVAKVTAHP